MQGLLGCPKSGLQLKRMQHIAESRYLKELCLEAAYVGDEGVLPLKDLLPFLRRLNLRHNKLTDVAVEFLAQNLEHATDLVDLNLSANSIGNTGARALATALKSTNSLRVLNLEQNDIGAAAGAAVGQGLASNLSMRILKLTDNRICDLGIGKSSLACYIQCRCTIYF